MVARREEFADAVDDALRALWRGSPEPFARLLDDGEPRPETLAFLRSMLDVSQMAGSRGAESGPPRHVRVGDAPST